MKAYNDICKIESIDNALEVDPLSVRSMDFYFHLTNKNNHVVDESEVARPDIISFNEYGTTTWWWVILLYNNIIDPYTIEANNKLMIPDLQNYYNISNKYRRINGR